MAILIDSWAWIEYFKGTPSGMKAQEYIESGQEVIISAINISEVYKFLLKEKGEEEAKIFIQYLFDTSFIINLDSDIAMKAAKLKHKEKFGLADAIVLATAKSHGCKVLTGDSDFKEEKDAVYIGDK